MKTPVLETERLILRPISLDDAPALQKYFNNWNIIQYLTAPWPYPEDGTETHIRDVVLPKIEEGTHLGWVLVTKEGKDTIGRIDYRFYNDPVDRGFWIAEPYWGQGLMSEAVKASQDYIFFDLDVERIVVENVKENTGSRRVKEKNGAVFLHEKESSCSHHIDGPSEVWEVTRENWAKIRGRGV